jgi:hypothetical protein
LPFEGQISRYACNGHFETVLSKELNLDSDIGHASDDILIATPIYFNKDLSGWRCFPNTPHVILIGIGRLTFIAFPAIHGTKSFLSKGRIIGLFSCSTAESDREGNLMTSRCRTTIAFEILQNSVSCTKDN